VPRGVSHATRRPGLERGSIWIPCGRSERGERRILSYPGNFTFDGTTLSTRVDAASDASRIGGDQVRRVRFENGAMVLAPARRLYANVMQHQELFWEHGAHGAS
jgi:hypothetical protein